MSRDLECDLEQIYFEFYLNMESLCLFLENFIMIAEETTKIENWLSMADIL